MGSILFISSNLRAFKIKCIAMDDRINIVMELNCHRTLAVKHSLKLCLLYDGTGHTEQKLICLSSSILNQTTLLYLSCKEEILKVMHSFSGTVYSLRMLSCVILNVYNLSDPGLWKTSLILFAWSLENYIHHDLAGIKTLR